MPTGFGPSVGEHAQIKRRGAVLCGRVLGVSLDQRSDLEWFEVRTAIGDYRMPSELVRRCQGLDDRCNCEHEAEKPAPVARSATKPATTLQAAGDAIKVALAGELAWGTRQVLLRNLRNLEGGTC